MVRFRGLRAACAAVLALVGTGVLTASPADAHFFHRFGYGDGYGYPWFYPRPPFYPRVFYTPPPVYVAPPVYGYRYGYGYGYHRVVYRYYRRPYYRHIVHTAAVHHRWCSCQCCR